MTNAAIIQPPPTPARWTTAYLFMLGAVHFSIQPMNVHDVSHDNGVDYAPKDLMQSPRPREWVGKADEHIRLLCTLFPTRFGGLNELQQLTNQMNTHEPQLLMRGDGTNMGYFFIERIVEHDTYLTPQGIGRVKEIELHLVGSPIGPGATALNNTLYSILNSTDTTPGSSPAPSTTTAVNSGSSPNGNPNPSTVADPTTGELVPAPTSPAPGNLGTNGGTVGPATTGGTF